jgi:16S rRNA processing protein RimM
MFIIGRVTGTHGVHGEVRIFPDTDDTERFSAMKTLRLRLNGREAEYKVRSIRYHKRFVIAGLSGVEDMNAAELLRGAEIIIEDSEALPLGPDEYYSRDLYGLKVFENGEIIGEVTDVFSTGSNEVYVISAETKKDILIPAIKSCVLSVDIAGGRMDVRVPEELR